jgi:hypothetical protein
VTKPAHTCTAGALGVLCLMVLAGPPACTRRTEPEAPASVALALDSVPESLRCVAVSVLTDRTLRHTWDPTAVTTLEITGLRPGPMVLTVEAYEVGCAEATAPTWLGGPVRVTLHPGDNGAVTVAMRPAGAASTRVTLDFDAGVSDFSPVGWACLADENCASHHCVFGDGGVGTCQPPAVPPPDAASGSVAGGTLPTLDQTTGYLIYAPGNDSSCNLAQSDCSPENPCLYAVTVRGGQPAPCLPAEMVAIPMTDLRLCTPGGACTPCTSEDCYPTTCFQRPPGPGDVTCDNSRIPSNLGPGDVLHFVLASKIPASGRDMARANAAERLPMVLLTRSKSTNADNIRVEWPGRPGAPFVVGKVISGLRDPQGAGGMCGGDPVANCGIFPMRAAGTFMFKDWSVTELDGAGQLFVWPISP